MNVRVAKSGGFCSGVQKAVDTAMSIEPQNTYILGELIHNRTVTEEIARRGIRTVESVEEVPDGANLILRSHGVGRGIYERCREKGLQVVDRTCPFVRHTQELIDRYSKEGKSIVVVGEPHHPEVVGLCGWCAGEIVVISPAEEFEYGTLANKELVVVAQTTCRVEDFKKIIENIVKVCKKTVEIFQTICYTTKERQREAEELAKKCDAMLVLGGANSSNTNRLYDICRRHCDHVFRLNSAADFSF